MILLGQGILPGNSMIRWIIVFLAVFSACYVKEDKNMPGGSVYRFDDDGAKTDGSPPTVSGWSATGNMITGDAIKETSLQAIFDEPGSYTVKFDLISPNVAFNNAVIRAEATIRWSVAGNEIVRKVTVAPGAAISCNAEAVKITIKDVTLTSKYPTWANIAYIVNVTVAKGLRTPNGYPAIFVPTFVTPSSAGGIFQGPPDVSAITLGATGAAAYGAYLGYFVPQNIGVLSFHISVVGHNGNVVPDGSVYVTQNGYNTLSAIDPRQMDWIPLIPGCYSVVIQNNNAFLVDVDLLWGIDG